MPLESPQTIKEPRDRYARHCRSGIRAGWRDSFRFPPVRTRNWHALGLHAAFSRWNGPHPSGGGADLPQQGWSPSSSKTKVKLMALVREHLQPRCECIVDGDAGAESA